MKNENNNTSNNQEEQEQDQEGETWCDSVSVLSKWILLPSPLQNVFGISPSTSTTRTTSEAENNNDNIHQEQKDEKNTNEEDDDDEFTKLSRRRTELITSLFGALADVSCFIPSIIISSSSSTSHQQQEQHFSYAFAAAEILTIVRTRFFVVRSPTDFFV